MNGLKAPLQSKTIQGVILLTLAFAKTFFDVEIGQAEIENVITGIAGALGIIYAIYGRIVAKSKIIL